jgi:hypothetical protein
VQTNKWNEDDQINYSRALARRLPAEVLYDAIQRATGSVSRLPGLPPGARAAQLLDSAQDAPGGFLDLFGKPPRESACECERSGGLMLGPVLNMVNGPVVADAIKDSSNRIATLLRKEKDSARVVEELYFAVLCRPPTKKELEAGLKALNEGNEDYAEMVAEAKRHQAALTAYQQSQPARQAQWEAGIQRMPVWQPLEVISAVSKAGAKLTKQPDGSYLASGPNKTPEVYTIKAKTKAVGITGIRLEVLTDKSLGGNGPGRAQNGNFVLTRFVLSGVEEGTQGKPVEFPFGKAQATFSQQNLDVSNAIGNNPATGWAIVPQTGRAHTAVFELRNPIGFSKGTELTIRMDQLFAAAKLHNIGRFRLSFTTTKPPLALNGPPPQLADALHVEPSKRTPQQKAVLTAAFEAQDAELGRLRGEVGRHPMPVDARQPGAQDLVWALINSKAFQFNH